MSKLQRLAERQGEMRDKVTAFPRSKRLLGPSAEFMGLDFNLIDQSTALSHLSARAHDAPFAYVVTPNVDHMVRLHRAGGDLWHVYRRAWITLCDSRILTRLAAASKLHLPVVTGSDLTVALFDNVIQPSDRIAILGGSDELIKALRDRYGLAKVEHYNPPMGFVRHPEEVRRAAEFLIGARARFSFLAIGSPQQEIVAQRVASDGGVGIGLCVGAGLEFLAGERKRAPKLMRALSLEWLFRLASDPLVLWRRYLVEGPRIFALYREWSRIQHSAPALAGFSPPPRARHARPFASRDYAAGAVALRAGFSAITSQPVTSRSGAWARLFTRTAAGGHRFPLGNGSLALRPEPGSCGSQQTGTPMIARARRTLGVVMIAACVASCGGVREDMMPSNTREEAVATPDRAKRIFISGHSLTERPIPEFLEAIAESLGTQTYWNQQSLGGSSLQARTRGHESAERPWNGYINGLDRAGQRIDVLEELRQPSATDGRAYDALIITENHALLDHILFADTVRSLRHFHENLIATNPYATTYLYESWNNISDADDPRSWIAYERAAAPAWRCIATRINQSLAAEGRHDRIRSVPAGSALAALVERMTVGAGVPGLSGETTRQSLARLFIDEVHLSPLGAYFVALVSYTTIYGRAPAGAWAPAGVTEPQAAFLQSFAWDFVTNDPGTAKAVPPGECSRHIRDFIGVYLAYQRDVRQRAEGTVRAYAVWLKHQIAWRYRLTRRDLSNPFFFDAVRDPAYWAGVTLASPADAKR